MSMEMLMDTPPRVRVAMEAVMAVAVTYIIVPRAMAKDMRVGDLPLLKTMLTLNFVRNNKNGRLGYAMGECLA